MELGLTDRTVWLTGATGGIGRAIARALVENGCRLAFCARTENDVKALESELNEIRGGNVGIVADVTRPGDLKHFAHVATDTLGNKLDGMIYGVGGTVGGEFKASSVDDWRRTFELNFFPAIELLYLAEPYLRATENPSVLLISSISGWKTVSRRAQYGAAKAALIYAAHALGNELGRTGIRINSISPGSTFFPGGGWAKVADENAEAFDTFQKVNLPFGRLAKPEEIAEVAVFLMSSRSHWINGANICVDGGQQAPSM